MKVGITRALTGRGLSSQHVTPTTTAFLEVPNKAFKPPILPLLLNGSNYPCEEKSIPKCLYLGLSQFGLCFGTMPLVFKIYTVHTNFKLLIWHGLEKTWLILFLITTYLGPCVRRPRDFMWVVQNVFDQCSGGGGALAKK